MHAPIFPRARFGRTLPCALGLALAAAPALAAPRVVADIAPIQSIVAAVMAGVGAPDAILPPGASPHGHSFRPSEARTVAEADLIVWVGPALTPWLVHPLESLGEDTPQLELMEAPGVVLLPVRESAAFEPHDHGAEGAQDEAHDGEDHDHDSHEEHDGHEPMDAHIWLDPANAAAIAAATAAKLGEIDPGNAAAYSANAAAFAASLDGLRAEVGATLAPVRGRGFLVFHDAYQYFEHAFDMPAAGSISLTNGAAPSPGRVAELRARILDSQVDCVFAEPQLESRLIATLIEGTPVRTGTLDPEGTAASAGPAPYPMLIRTLAGALADCLDG